MSSLATTRSAFPAARPPAYANLAEAAEYCRVSSKTLTRAIRAGRLVALKVGARVVIAYSALDAFVTGQGADQR